MKILIIDEEFPYPLNTGKRIRSYSLAMALARKHDVTYMAYGEEKSPEVSHFQKQNLSVIAVNPPDRSQAGAKFYGRLGLNLFSRYPYIVTSHYTARFHNRLKEAVAQGETDCILCEWSPYAIFLKGLASPKKIIVAHNVESSIWNGYTLREKNPIRKIYIAEQARKVAVFERECFRWADGATAVSEEDASLINKYRPSFNVEVIENGVDTDYFAPQSGPVDKNKLVFTGSMDWRPNQDAAIYFASEVFPLIRKNKPRIEVYFVGRNPGGRVKELTRIPGFHVTGTVDDVRPYIANAGAYIVPLRIGGGSRLKILEAMSMRKPVVSTTLGAEGLRVRDGENILIRDDPNDFARAVCACLDDVKLSQRISENGRDTVCRHYRWDELGAKLSNYICETIMTR